MCGAPGWPAGKGLELTCSSDRRGKRSLWHSDEKWVCSRVGRVCRMGKVCFTAAPAACRLFKEQRRRLPLLVHAGSDCQEGQGVGVPLAPRGTLLSELVAARVSRKGPAACAAPRCLCRHRGVSLKGGGRVPRGAGRSGVRLDWRRLRRQQACGAGGGDGGVLARHRAQSGGAWQKLLTAGLAQEELASASSRQSCYFTGNSN